MLVRYEFPDRTVSGSNITYKKQLKISGSPVLILLDILYGDTNLPECAIQHLLNLDEKYRTLLCTVLCKYCDVFPGTLPT